MNKPITVLVSLGVVLFGQAVFGQTATKTQQKTWSTRPAWATQQAATQAEVEAQIKEAAAAKNANGSYGIKTNPNKPGSVYVNGKEYKRDRTKYPENVAYMDKGRRVYSEQNPTQRTYVNGKDTIQVGFYPKQQGDIRRTAPNSHVAPAPNSDVSSRIHSEDGSTVTKAAKTADGKDYFIEKRTKTPQGTYTMRFKGNTSHEPSRADIQGSRFQAAKNTNIAETFGNELKDRNVYGPEALYGK